MVVKVAAVFLLFCTFAHAADGLSLYTDPDFPNFSFEYDPLEWSIEQQILNPVTSRELKIVTARNLNGEALVFSFEYPKEADFVDCLEMLSKIPHIGDVALRFNGDTSYYPTSSFTLCANNFAQCQEATQGYNLQMTDEILAVGCRMPFFETTASANFVTSLNIVSGLLYLREDWQTRI
jgi:hypothetical protein